MNCRITVRAALIGVVAVLICAAAWPVAAGESEKAADFRSAKTIFQTNTRYDPRLAIAVDGVIVHRHGAAFEGAFESWRRSGFNVGRMFFADSDASNAYWTGKWDGTPHPDDVERDRAGKVVKCAGVRPYMLPTEGWIRHLEEMTDKSLAAGAIAICPEEPLAHVFTGYEKSFQQIWAGRYGTPWRPQHASAEARFLTAQLKNELYIKLEKRLLGRTKRFAAANGKDVAFVLPIHSIYSNIAAQLVAPLGTSADIEGIDGYIGQIWTGPVNWALGCYDSRRKSFFASAYVLYDYFTQLTVGSDKRLWLLVDPVEDNPNHKWSEFAEWYKHCIAAMLLMDEVDSYEIMPWPDRIFLPGYGTGGGTPAPEDYRITILAVTQVLQEVTAGGKWSGREDSNGRIGVAIADTLMWQRLKDPRLQGVYSLFVPLVERGVPVSSFVMERLADAAYTSRFKVIVLSYESFKPTEAAMNVALADWVRGGGVLIVLGEDGDELDECESFWWHKLGFESALQHLLKQVGAEGAQNAPRRFEAGWVIRSAASPKRFADSGAAETTYLPLIELAVMKSGRAALERPGSFVMRRGPFIIAHAESSPVKVTGRLVDVFDPKLALHDSVELGAGRSGLYRDVSYVVKEGRPVLLHATHRLIWQRYEEGALRLKVRGPAGTPAVARVLLGEGQVPEITVADGDGKKVGVETTIDGNTALLKFANSPGAVTVTLR
ncbi:MAG: hypothetical protein JSU94_03200 [Phycisphaerales bacterium]|nr:MAG: hypothetical protein JSU94_03200 [Phycisphaerales bacterium]